VIQQLNISIIYLENNAILIRNPQLKPLSDYLSSHLAVKIRKGPDVEKIKIGSDSLFHPSAHPATAY
jgi:hypothetical protein